jgi:hypothetical protein
MPRHANTGTFEKGHQRSPESIEKQRQTMKRQIAQGLRKLPGQPGPNPKKGHPGHKNHTWKPVGTKSYKNTGYVYIKIAEPNVWKYEHRWVMEQMLGRELTRNDHVHHLNFDKTDNRPENLVLMTRSEHMSLPSKDNGHPRCNVCGYRHPPH